MRRRPRRSPLLPSATLFRSLVRALLAAGHDVTGLVRGKPTPAKAVKGDLKDPKTYEAAARECDAIVHTGFEPSPRAVEADRTRSEKHTSELQSQSNIVCRRL